MRIRVGDDSKYYRISLRGGEMTDCQILGLKESFSHDELKKAYREKSKQFHPDKNKDNLNSHLAMIRLNQAYSNLLKRSETAPPKKEEPRGGDIAYTIYKEGISKFQSIHPAKWKTYSKDGLFDPNAVTTHPETPSIIQAMITKMAEAYHSFSIIINEHENSPWYSDSLRKMREIEKMTQRYMKIKESYEQELNK